MSRNIEGMTSIYDRIFSSDDYEVNSASIKYIDSDGKVENHSSYDVLNRAIVLSEILSRSGIRAGNIIGIHSENRIEWIVWDIACLKLGVVIHAFPENQEYDYLQVMQKYGLSIVVTDRPNECDIRSCVYSICDTPKLFNISENRITAPEDHYSYVYSSGSSGYSKGLVINKKSLIPLLDRFCSDFNINDQDCSLIFLPFSNFQQRLIAIGCMHKSASIVLCNFSQSFSSLVNHDITFTIAPPIFYENFLEFINISPIYREKILSYIRFMITGMAPISINAVEALNDLGIELCEAYGLTECGMISWNTIGKQKYDSVGKLLYPENIEILDSGEILIKVCDESLCLGYFENENDNDHTFSNGFIHTGDIGYIKDGYLYLNGRIKNLVIGKSGKKYHLEKIEKDIDDYIGDVSTIAVAEGVTIHIYAYTGMAANSCAETVRMIESYLSDNFSGVVIGKIVCGDIEPLRNKQWLTRNYKIDRAKVKMFIDETENSSSIKLSML